MNTSSALQISPWKGCKVFGIGLGKTGTTSLAAAMATLGLRVKHSPRYVDEIQEHDFSNDIAVAWRFRFLDFVYPNAKFILTVRELRSWLASCAAKDAQKSSKGTLRRQENRFMCFGRTNYKESDFILAYQRHLEDVTAHFRDRPEKLLVMNICEGDGWGKLCPFIGVQVPNIPFPHNNKRVAE
jgi:hypothetical protein